MTTTNPAPANNQAQAASLYPNKPGFKPAQPVIVGGEILMSDPIEYNTGRKTAKLVVRNTGDRPIQVGSHFHFFEVNRYLEFDRDAAFGCHPRHDGRPFRAGRPEGGRGRRLFGQAPRDRLQRPGDGLHRRGRCPHLFPGAHQSRGQSPEERFQKHPGERCRCRCETE